MRAPISVFVIATIFCLTAGCSSRDDAEEALTAIQTDISKLSVSIDKLYKLTQAACQNAAKWEQSSSEAQWNLEAQIASLEKKILSVKPLTSAVEARRPYDETNGKLDEVLNALSELKSNDRHLAKLEHIEAEVKALRDQVSTPDVSSLVAQARTALEEGNLDRGFAFLSAALSQSPFDEGAFSLIRENTKKAAESPPEMIGPSTTNAESWLAIYGETIQNALREANTVEQIERLLKDEADFIALHDQWEAIQEPMVTDVDLDAKLASLEREVAGTPSEVVLRKAVIQAERLRDEAIEQMLDTPGNEADERLSRVVVVLSDLNDRIDALSVSMLQRNADQKTEEILARVKASLDSIDRKQREKLANAKSFNGTWQSLGKEMAIVELNLAQISPLASPNILKQVAETRNRLHSLSIMIGARQQATYNSWAIDKIKNAVDIHNKNKGYFNDFEGPMKRSLIEDLGVIDPGLLHPAVSSLYSETYTTLISELDEKEKITATEAVEAQNKKSLQDF